MAIKQKIQTETTQRQDQFLPGGIHTQEAVEFWRTVLKANQWVIEVLENGYVIPFDKEPLEYEEENNKSAKTHSNFVRKTVIEMEKAGIVQFIKAKPLCVSPLTVAEKLEPDGTKKLRLCWDGSRCVNLCLAEQKVTLAHLQRTLEMTTKNDFQVKYDLKSAFHHIKIHNSHTKYLGAAFTNEKGEKQFLSSYISHLDFEQQHIASPNL